MWKGQSKRKSSTMSSKGIKEGRQHDNCNFHIGARPLESVITTTTIMRMISSTLAIDLK